jgi:hypothetical protein
LGKNVLLNRNNQLLIRRREGKKEGLSVVEMKVDGRDGMSLLPALRGGFSGKASRGGEWNTGQGGGIKRESFSCGVQPGFLAEAAKKANSSGRHEWNSERLSR